MSPTILSFVTVKEICKLWDGIMKWESDYVICGGTFNLSRTGSIELNASKQIQVLSAVSTTRSCKIRQLAPPTSVRPHVITRQPLYGFSRNLILDNFTKICLHTIIFIKIGQEYRTLCVYENLHTFPTCTSMIWCCTFIGTKHVEQN
jgi:hypothetical protein